MSIESIEYLHEKGVRYRKQIEELLIALKERALIEELYAKDLERFANNLPVTDFKEVTEYLRQVTLHIASQSYAFAQNMTLSIVDDFKELLNSQAQSIKDHYQAGIKNEKRKKRLGKKVEESKFKYLNFCEECEQVALSLDSETSSSKREKLVQKLILSKNTLDAFYRAYLEDTERYNKYKKTYLLRTKKIISAFNQQESQLIENLNKAQEDIWTCHCGCSSTLGNSEISQTVLTQTVEDCSALLKYPDCTFESYEGVHPLFKNLGINSAPHLHASILEISGADKGTQTAVENMYRTEIGSIINKAWEGHDLTSQEYLHFNAMLKEHLGRKAWSWCMNLKRTQGIFVIDVKGFEHIGELMVALLNECERSQDVIIAKNCIILSQTFYKLTNNSKEYLQNFIITHTLWTNRVFWEKVINSAIGEELKNQGDIEIQKEHLKSLVFCQLVSFGHIMMSFKVDEECINQLVTSIGCNYDFSEEETKEIIVKHI